MRRTLNAVPLYVLSGVLSIGMAVLANILLPGELSTIGATFAILAPLGSLLMVDRLTTQSDQHRDHEALLKAVRSSSSRSGQIISIKNDAGWVDYMTANAQRARRIYNTRLSDYVGKYDSFHERIDAEMVRAVVDGTEYHVICSVARTASLEQFRQALEMQGAASGRVFAYTFDTAGKPLLQMKIFDYDDYSEALIGFVVRSERDTSQPIFLVRNIELVEYLRYVFNSYAESESCTRTYVH